MFPHIKLYAKLSISGRARTIVECLKNFEDIKKEYNLKPSNAWEEKIIDKPKNIHLKYVWECSFYEDKTLKEMEEDKELKL